jgi:hypothetical protein
MKNLLLLAFICLSTSIYAQSIKLVSGELDFLKSEQYVDVKFTYDNLRVGKLTEEEYVAKKTGKKGKDSENWYEKWISDRKNMYEPKFIELFDKKMTPLGIEISSEGNYLMHIQTDFIEPGFNIGITRQNASIDFTATFIEKETGDEVAKITVFKSSANSFTGTDFDAAYRIGECYAKGGRELAAFIVKKLKK